MIPFDAILAVRWRLEQDCLDFLAGNPPRSDPNGARLARRIARVADWCGPVLWAQLNQIIAEPKLDSPVVQRVVLRGQNGEKKEDGVRQKVLTREQAPVIAIDSRRLPPAGLVALRYWDCDWA